MERIEHHGRSTAYRLADRGDGERTLVFVHGSGADHRVWKAQDRLARRHRVVAVDLSGHGESDDIDTDPGQATLEAYADDVTAVVEATDGEVLIGNSLGGAITLWVALERDLDLAGIGLVGTGAKLAVHEDLRRWLREEFERAVDVLHEPNRYFVEPDSPLGVASRETMLTSGRRVTARDFLTCHTFDVRDRLDEVAEPTLVIGGARDELTPPWYHEFLADEIDEASLTIVEDAAHLVFLERPERFNRTVEDFLEDLS